MDLKLTIFQTGLQWMMYGTIVSLPDFIMTILTCYLQLRLVQDLYGSANHGWRKRRQKEGTVAYEEISLAHDLSLSRARDP